MGHRHLGASFLVAPASGAARLGYLTPMERDEAAGTGLELLSPEALGIDDLRRRGATGALSETHFWTEALVRGLALARVEPGRIALAGRYPAGLVHAACSRLQKRGWRFEPAHALLLELRKSKTRAELDEIRAAAQAAAAALRAVAALLARSEPGADGLRLDGRPLTAGRLRAVISEVLAGHGMEQPEGNIVAAGADAGVPHTQGASEAVLQAGTALVVDLFPRRHLFADCTRTFCVGPAPPELTRAHSVVERVLGEARRGAAAGRAASELQELVCELFAQAGYATTLSDPGTTRGYVHGLGHGVGIELHEYPSFRSPPGPAGVLAEGDVFTLEPGLYDPAAGWGVRLEDLYTLTADGPELLTPLPYDLDPTVWP